MNTNPLVSVIIPTYNHAHFLSRALQSLMDQSFTNWEALVVDNHSTDGTDELMRQVHDSRIRFMKVHNQGVIAVSRNTAIAASRGEWLAFLDSDDWWTKDKLAVCLSYAQNGAEFIYHDLIVVRHKKSVFDRNHIRTRQLVKPVLIDLLLHGNVISNSSVMVKRRLLESVGLLNESPVMAGAEDFNGWLKIARQTDRFKYVPRFLGFYAFHASGVSRKDMSVCFSAATKEFMNELDESQRKRLQSHTAYMKSRFNLTQKKFSETIEWAKVSFTDGDKTIKMKSAFVLAMARVLLLLKKIIGR